MGKTDGQGNTSSLLNHAAIPVGTDSLVWKRGFDVPADKVWQAISTKEGLEKWWMVRSGIEIDLSVGGLFKHHWISTIHEIEHDRHIIFDEPEGGWMRFQVEPDAGGSIFTLMVVWQGLDVRQPKVWDATAGGWHGAVDELEKALTGKGPNAPSLSGDEGWDLGDKFYRTYLQDLDCLAKEAVALKALR